MTTVEMELKDLKVLLTSAYPDHEPITTARKLAGLDKHKVHELIDDPDAADLILFIENSQYTNDYFFDKLRRHPYVKKYKSKTLMYNEQDHPFYVIPGLYVSQDKSHYDPLRQRATAYVTEINKFIEEYAPKQYQPDILYSFKGMKRKGVRAKLFNGSHPNGLVEDTTGFNAFIPKSRQNELFTQQQKDYADLLIRSKFVLCPRGSATSSYRLYETMQIGRVPVILSDEWIPPMGPNWNEFAVFVPEEDVNNIHSILTELDSTWQDKGKLARQAWENYFAPNVLFHYMIEQCEDILLTSQNNPDLFKRKITQQEMYMRLRIGLNPVIKQIRRVLK